MVVTNKREVKDFNAETRARARAQSHAYTPLRTLRTLRLKHDLLYSVMLDPQIMLVPCVQHL